MTFAQPAWLLAGLLICIALVFVFRTLEKKRSTTLARFASQQLIGKLTRNLSRTRRGYKNGLLLLSVFLLFVALARPQYGFEWVDVKRKGIDLLFALDTSKSMLAEDIKPNRLKRAHFAILDFVQRLKGDRVGLLPFAGSSFLMCPLTMDYEAFEQSLMAITTDIIPRGGTNLGGVIEAASKILTNGANHKILIILTDGENLEGDVLGMAEKYGKEGLTIYTVGVGTSGGELIPVAGGKGFVKDSSGKYVTSKLDEAALTKIAELTGGIYAPLGGSGQGLETIYQQKLSLIPKEELSERRHKLPIDRFEWPLAAALFFLVIELLLGERRRNGKRPLLSVLKNSLKRKKEIAALVALLVTAVHTGAKASPGEDAFAADDYLGAAEYYRQQLEISPDSPELQYNYGVSSYKNNMHDDAIAAFTNALKSDDVELQKKTYFNLGNSHFQKGVESQQGDAKATVEEWKQAITFMDSVIKLNPDDERAKNNREVFQKQLEQLEQQMEEQQDQQNQDNQDQQEGEDGQEQKSDSGEQQGEEGKDQQQQDNPSQDKNSGEQNAGDKQDEQTAAGQKEEQAGDEEKQDSAKESSESPEPINQLDENSAAEEKSAQEQAEQDAIRQQQGKMTKEEAERLLNALKNQEGELNFIPSGGADDNEIEKDW